MVRQDAELRDRRLPSFLSALAHWVAWLSRFARRGGTPAVGSSASSPCASPSSVSPISFIVSPHGAAELCGAPARGSLAVCPGPTNACGLWPRSLARRGQASAGVDSGAPHGTELRRVLAGSSSSSQHRRPSSTSTSFNSSEEVPPRAASSRSVPEQRKRSERQAYDVDPP
ncbi:hypothetical protein PVAP13_7KG247055 [Panicum virgatum]|jgi:hypothetical protein|uniref:Uncharacterized protein n=1 Tax=Panicum virgatum TaxID=38727 RepID=A0A8T0QKJ0_PANVG|nr:hypothetical protein PVAP13_7KG247055 [Panicum virgatum]